MTTNQPNPEAVEAAARALYEAVETAPGSLTWDELAEGHRQKPYPDYPHLYDAYVQRARVALLAALPLLPDVGDLLAEMDRLRAVAVKPDRHPRTLPPRDDVYEAWWAAYTASIRNRRGSHPTTPTEAATAAAAGWEAVRVTLAGGSDQDDATIVFLVRTHDRLVTQMAEALGLDPDRDDDCVPGCADGPAGSEHLLWHLIQRATVKPNRDTLAHALRGIPLGPAAFAGQVRLEIADAVLAVLPGRTEAQVRAEGKVEGIREAAEAIEMGRSPAALRASADRIERGEV